MHTHWPFVYSFSYWCAVHLPHILCIRVSYVCFNRFYYNCHKTVFVHCLCREPLSIASSIHVDTLRVYHLPNPKFSQLDTVLTNIMFYICILILFQRVCWITLVSKIPVIYLSYLVFFWTSPVRFFNHRCYYGIQKLPSLSFSFIFRTFPFLLICFRLQISR